MASFRGIQGTPWHIEIHRMPENEVRRHRSYCEHYDKESKRCFQFLSACHGATHCKYYTLRRDEKRVPEQHPVEVADEVVHAINAEAVKPTPLKKAPGKKRKSTTQIETVPAYDRPLSAKIKKKPLPEPKNKRPVGMTKKVWDTITYGSYIGLIQFCNWEMDFDEYCELNPEVIKLTGKQDLEQVRRRLMDECTYMDGNELKPYPIAAFRASIMRMHEEGDENA